MNKLIVTGVVLVIIGSAMWIGRPAYRHYKERKFAVQARSELAKGQARQALLSARQVLALNTNNITACEVLAELSDQGNSPQAVVWRQRVAQIDPTPSNQVMLAASALRYEQPPFPIATKSLSAVAAKADQLPLYHVIAAQLALKQNHPAEAEKHFEDVIRLEPTNALHRLNLATVRLASTNVAKQTEARQELNGLRSNPDFGAHALRALVQHHLSRQEMDTALGCSAELLKHPRAAFEDTLTHLRLLHEAKKPEYVAFESKLKVQVETNAVQTFAVARQLLAFGEAKDVLTWLKSLPTDKQNQPPVPLAIADAYASQKEWHALEEYLNAQNWKEQECVRLALLAYAVRNQKDDTVSRVHWNKAVQAASDRPEQLRAISQLALGWGWRPEAEELLSRVARDMPQEQWAVEALHASYARQRNSHGLYAIYSLLMDRPHPNSLVQNNFAALSLLLNTNLAQAHELAEKVYRSDTNNIAFLSTYAWSVYLKGDPARALRLMEQIDARRLADPALASYYGALLVANGQAAKATDYLATAEAAEILPEEKALVATARSRLTR